MASHFLTAYSHRVIHRSGCYICHQHPVKYLQQFTFLHQRLIWARPIQSCILFLLLLLLFFFFNSDTYYYCQQVHGRMQHNRTTRCPMLTPSPTGFGGLASLLWNQLELSARGRCSLGSLLKPEPLAGACSFKVCKDWYFMPLCTSHTHQLRAFEFQRRHCEAPLGGV